MTAILFVIFQIFIMKSTAFVLNPLFCYNLLAMKKYKPQLFIVFVLLHAVSKYVSNQEVVQLIEVPPI